jgi:hypothetical protein
MPVEHYRHEHGLDAEALAEAEGDKGPGSVSEPPR